MILIFSPVWSIMKQEWGIFKRNDDPVSCDFMQTLDSHDDQKTEVQG